MIRRIVTMSSELEEVRRLMLQRQSAWFRRSNGLTTVTADGFFVRIFSRICLLWLQLQRLRC